ncbi:hypothetical protein OHW66_03515 [Acinetobacter baumannii]|uniref:hypothetical protein n=1 Tax=Acinetobacter baumannii TaxID=470 RepID=UPI00092CC5E5|nr:hypothetical protein [Acinetobacter baumannii]MDC5353586.1 hypothetical protein [Acinetobacter baumannii]OJK07660.1 hypothetical protein BRY75_06440 [Acinetobacter baumannii]
MTEQEIKCYENISRHIHGKGVEMLQGGNPCSSVVSVLFYVEDILRHQGIESAVVSALCDDLEKHNRESIEALRELGDSSYGY